MATDEELRDLAKSFNTKFETLKEMFTCRWYYYQCSACQAPYRFVGALSGIAALDCDGVGRVSGDKGCGKVNALVATKIEPREGAV